MFLVACTPTNPNGSASFPEAFTPSAPTAKPSPLPFEVAIGRTSYGFPHIVAKDYASLGYGHGYALAQDNLCVLAEQIITVNAERARYFGTAGAFRDEVLSDDIPNLNSDFYYQAIKDNRTVETLLSRPPPLGPSQEVRELVRGYVAGYNRYLRETGVDNLPDPRCRGAAWVRPITEMDIYRHHYSLSLLASSNVFINGMVEAKPPPANVNIPTPSPDDIDPSSIPNPKNMLIGSNALALGQETSTNARSILLGNPHFPWNGHLRFYEVHLVIPGVLNVSGATLSGVPVVLLGHNERIAWSHTVSSAFRFTPYELKLAPGRPTRYIYEGREHEMTTQTVTVYGLNTAGVLQEYSHTFYRTRFGPVFVYPKAKLTWTHDTAYALRDVNADNLRVMDQFLAMGKAQNVVQLRQVQEQLQGIPWVNTVAIDDQGNAYYADQSVVPHVTNPQIERCVVSPIAQALLRLGRLPVLDGTRAECEWGSDPDAVKPGMFGPGNLPRLLRTDYVANSNDSYWLTNLAQPITGYALIIGDEGTARSLRTRLALRMVQARLTGADGQAGTRFSTDQLHTMAFNNRNQSGELFRNDAVAFCKRTPFVVLSDNRTVVDVREACPVLENWDLRGNLESSGAPLWREFIKPTMKAHGGPYVVPFDKNDPLNTPHTLDTSHPQIVDAFGAAVQNFRNAGIPLNATIGQVQFVRRGRSVIPIHGCSHPEGCFNNIGSLFQLDDGQSGGGVTGGSSFVFTVAFTDTGPVAHSILTYSQSSNPTSPHYADQTHLYSRKEWVRRPFTLAEVENDPAFAVLKLRE